MAAMGHVFLALCRMEFFHIFWGFQSFPHGYSPDENSKRTVPSRGAHWIQKVGTLLRGSFGYLGYVDSNQG